MGKVVNVSVLGPGATPAEAKQALVETHMRLSAPEASPANLDDCSTFIRAVGLIAKDLSVLMPDVAGDRTFEVRTPRLLHALDGASLPQR